MAAESEASYGDEEFDAESEGGYTSAAATTEFSQTLHEPVLSDEEEVQEELAEETDRAEESKQEARSEKADEQSQNTSSLLGKLREGIEGLDQTVQKCCPRGETLQLSKEVAAVRIQKVERGRQARQKLARQKQAAKEQKAKQESIAPLETVATQSVPTSLDASNEIRLKQKPEEEEEQLEADVAMLQLMEAKPSSTESTEAALKIQSIARGRAARREAENRRRKRRLSQARREAEARAAEHAAKEEDMKRSVVKIQSYHRGRMARRRVRNWNKQKGMRQSRKDADRKVQSGGTMKEREDAAARAIQKAQKARADRSSAAQKEVAYKGYLRNLARHALRGIYDVAIANANWQLQREELEKRAAAVKLQSACRARFAREEAKRRRKARVPKQPQNKDRGSSSAFSSSSAGSDSHSARDRRSQAKMKMSNEKVAKDNWSEDAQRAIVKIQSSVRKVWNTKEHKREKKKSMKKKQTTEMSQHDEWHPEAIRARMERLEKDKQECAAQEKSAVQIQKAYRGKIARVNTLKMKEEREKARREARRLAEARASEWDVGVHSSFCHSSRLSVSQSQVEASARRIQRFARKRTNSFMKAKPDDGEKVAKGSGQEVESLGKIEEADQAAAADETKTAAADEEATAPARPDASKIDPAKKQEIDEAIVRIQAAQRQRQARKEAKNLKRQKEVEAATLKVQAIRRGVLTRRDHKAPARPPSPQSPQSLESRPQSVQARWEMDPQVSLSQDRPAVPETVAKQQAAPESAEVAHQQLFAEREVAIEQDAVADQEVAADQETAAAEPSMPTQFAAEDELNLTLMPGKDLALPTEVLEAAAVAGPATSAERPITRRSFDAQWHEESSSATTEAAVAADSTAAACIDDAIAAASLGGAAPPATVLEAAAVAAAAAAARPVTRRSFDAQGLEDMPNIAAVAAVAEAVAGTADSAPVSPQNCNVQGLEGESNTAEVAPEEVAHEEDIIVTCDRGSSLVCDLAVQCYGADADYQDEDIVFCGRPPRAQSQRQTCCFVREKGAQTDAWLLGEMHEVASFSADDGYIFEAQALWPSPPVVSQPAGAPRKCQKSGRRLRRPAPVGIGTIRAGAIYKNPPCNPASPWEAVAARGFSEPRQPSAGSAPPSRRGRSARPHSVREALKPPGSAPSACGTSASPGLGKVRQPPPMLSAFGRVLSGPTAAYSAQDLFKERSQSPPTSGSQLRRLCDPLWKIQSAQARLRAPATAPATAPASDQQTAAADAVRQREGLGTAPAGKSMEDEIFREVSSAGASRNAESACRAGLSSAPASARRQPKAAAAVPGILAKPRSAKLTPNRPLRQDAGKDVRPGMKKLPGLPVALNAAAVYDPRFLDRDVINHFPRPFDRRHLEEEIMGRPSW